MKEKTEIQRRKRKPKKLRSQLRARKDMIKELDKSSIGLFLKVKHAAKLNYYFEVENYDELKTYWYERLGYEYNGV